MKKQILALLLSLLLCLSLLPAPLNAEAAELRYVKVGLTPPSAPVKKGGRVYRLPAVAEKPWRRLSDAQHRL